MVCSDACSSDARRNGPSVGTCLRDTPKSASLPWIRHAPRPGNISERGKSDTAEWSKIWRCTMFGTISFYVDKEKYDEAGIAVAFAPLIIGALYSDVVQAYNLIPPESRSTTIKIIDNSSGEAIYDSSKE